MIILDKKLDALEAQGKPIRVALIGAGCTGAWVALQLATSARGMRLAVIVNRTPARAESALTAAGIVDFARVSSVSQAETAMATGKTCVTDDFLVACESPSIDVIIEATGHVEFGCQAVYHAIRHGKHVVLMGAEIDASVGPILKTYADKAGVIYTYTDGDEPGVGMNLYRLVDSMGYRPVLMGQMKGFLDRYRNPQTQQGFADKNRQNPVVMSAFADGSKLALEAAIMGNATGFIPQVRGMKGYPCAHVQDLIKEFSPDDFVGRGLVEYSLGAAPHTGAFVLCINDHPEKRRVMSYLKMGDGPLYLFYTPYHLPPMQVAHSVARAVLAQDATIAPGRGAVCDTVAYAKRDLKAGETLDGVGGHTCYGLVERFEVCSKEQFLPIAISLDCRLNRSVVKDEPLRYSDVTLPVDRLCDRLRTEQSRVFQ